MLANLVAALQCHKTETVVHLTCASRGNELLIVKVAHHPDHGKTLIDHAEVLECGREESTRRQPGSHEARVLMAWFYGYVSGNYPNEQAQLREQLGDVELSRLAELEMELATHDWDYEYSDDPRCYRRGLAEWRRIKELRDELGDEGQRLYERYKG